MKGITAAPPPPVTVSMPTAGTMRACLFVLGNEHFAVEVERARGVVVLDDVTIVPGAPAHVLGIANLRGSLIPVIDLRPHLRVPAPAREAPIKALVIEHAAVQAAVAIDGVVGLESFDQALPLGPADRGRYGDLAVARLPGTAGPCMLLDVTCIIEALRIHAVSADDASGGISTRRTPKDG